MELSAAIRMGTPGPPVLGRFLLRRMFWKELGMREADVLALPAQEIDDYVLIFQMIQREEQNRNRRS